jgi:hypothetical protein
MFKCYITDSTINNNPNFIKIILFYNLSSIHYIIYHADDSPAFFNQTISTLFGLYIGNPNARDHTPFAKHPIALETANTTV